MGQQQHLHIFDYDVFLVPTAGEIEVLIGYHPSDSDTASARYINIGTSDNNCQGFDITADQTISLIEVNNRTLKEPRPIVKNGLFTIQRGDWHQFKFLTTVANTTIQMDVVA